MGANPIVRSLVFEGRYHIYPSSIPRLYAVYTVGIPRFPFQMKNSVLYLQWTKRTGKQPNRQVHFLLQKNTGNDERRLVTEDQLRVRRFFHAITTHQDDDPEATDKRKDKYTMDYENFKERFVEDLKDKLYEQGSEVNISVQTVKKLNESYEAVTITPDGSNIGVNIPIDKFYEALDAGKTYDEVVDKAVEVIKSGLSQRPDLDVNTLSDYSVMKEKLAMEVVSAETNKEMLETVPHQNIEDMAVVYRFVLTSDDDGRASILVTNQLIQSMGVTPEQLHADALENAPIIKPAEIKGMSEVMAEMMGVEQAEMMGLYPVAPEDEKIYVATVPDKVHGAGVLAYQNFMDQAAERAGGDFFILPSSIHEVLIVPDNGQMQLKDLEAMVRDVNATQVAPADKLTDNVYHYDSKEKIFELGEKFVERQAEREVEHSEEKGEKSVIDELKAKKEEVAKTPKKEPVEKAAKSKGGEAL